MKVVIVDWCWEATDQLTKAGYTHNQVFEDITFTAMMDIVQNLMRADLDVMLTSNDQFNIIAVDLKGKKFRQR